jgi:hypothetical protein
MSTSTVISSVEFIPLPPAAPQIRRPLKAKGTTTVTRQMSPNLVTLITPAPTFQSVSDFVDAFKQKDKTIANLTAEFVATAGEAKQKQDEILSHLAFMQSLLSKKGANHGLVIEARKQKHNIPWWTRYYATYKDKLWESLRTMERRIAAFRKDPSVATTRPEKGTRPKYLTQLEHKLLGTATNIHEALVHIKAGHIEEAVQKLSDDLPTQDRIAEHLERGVKPTHANPDDRASSAADELATALANEPDQDVASKMLTDYLRTIANQFANGRITIKEVTARIEFAGRDERIMQNDWLEKREMDAAPTLCKCVGVAEFMKRRKVQEWTDGKWQKEHVVYSGDERDYRVVTEAAARTLAPAAFPPAAAAPTPAKTSEGL